MRIVRTVGQAFDVCHRLALQKQEQEQQQQQQQQTQQSGLEQDDASKPIDTESEVALKGNATDAKTEVGKQKSAKSQRTQRRHTDHGEQDHDSHRVHCRDHEHHHSRHRRHHHHRHHQQHGHKSHGHHHRPQRHQRDSDERNGVWDENLPHSGSRTSKNRHTGTERTEDMIKQGRSNSAQREQKSGSRKLGIPHSLSRNSHEELGSNNVQSSVKNSRLDLPVDVRDSDNSVKDILIADLHKPDSEDVMSTNNSTGNSAKHIARTKSENYQAAASTARSSASPVCSTCMSHASSSESDEVEGESASSSASSQCSYPRSSRRSSKSALRTPSESESSGTGNSDSVQSPRPSKTRPRCKHRTSNRLSQTAHDSSFPARIKGSMTTQDLVWMLQTGGNARSNEFSLAAELNSILSATMSPTSFIRYPEGIGLPQSRSVDNTLAKVLMDESTF